MRVNIQELADVFGVSRPTITAWIDDGLPYVSPGSKGKQWVFDTVDALEWWAENKRRRKTRSPAPGDDPFAEGGDGRESIEEAERRKMVANADRAELALAKDAKAVVLIDDVTSVVAEMNVRVRTRLLSIGNQVRMQARAFFAEDRAAEEQVVTTVEEIIADALGEIRDDCFGEAEEAAPVET